MHLQVKTEFTAETFSVPRATRELYRKGLRRDWSPWANAWVVRIWNQKTQEKVEGGGSSRRVAAMRAAEAAEKKGWF